MSLIERARTAAIVMPTVVPDDEPLDPQRVAYYVTLLRELATALEEAAAREERYREVLRRVEWTQQRWNGAPSCPACGGYRHLEGHDPGCELLAALDPTEPSVEEKIP